MITTYRYRIKDSGRAGKFLAKMSCSVNRVWNYCKEAQKYVLKTKTGRMIKDKKSGKDLFIPYFFSSSELDALVAGSSKELGLHSQTVQFVSQEYVKKRIQHKNLLRWRGRKSLGWVPFKASAIKIIENKIVYNKHTFSYWNSRSLPADAKIKMGSFCQDKRGRWYLNITFESNMLAIERTEDKEIGIDIGIKTLATCSDGVKIERPDLRKRFLEDLKRLKKTQKYAQRMQARNKKYFSLPKRKQERNLYAKVTNTREDYLHKESTKLVKKCSLIVVGDVPCKLMNRSKTLSGISLDSGIGMFKNMLKYKAMRAASTYKEFSERNSTLTCSKCRIRRPRIELGVRNWNCENCGSVHDRDTNAAINILQAYQKSIPVAGMLR